MLEISPNQQFQLHLPDDPPLNQREILQLITHPPNTLPRPVLLLGVVRLLFIGSCVGEDGEGVGLVIEGRYYNLAGCSAVWGEGVGGGGRGGEVRARGNGRVRAGAIGGVGGVRGGRGRGYVGEVGRGRGRVA